METSVRSTAIWGSKYELDRKVRGHSGAVSLRNGYQLSNEIYASTDRLSVYVRD